MPQEFRQGFFHLRFHSKTILSRFFLSQVSDCLLAGFFRQDCRIKPAQGQPRIGRLIPERVDQFRSTFIVVDKNKSFFSFNKRQDVELPWHEISLPVAQSVPQTLVVPPGIYRPAKLGGFHKECGNYGK
jgi:hypothetical protein